jgi:hypothetical protein
MEYPRVFHRVGFFYVPAICVELTESAFTGESTMNVERSAMAEPDDSLENLAAELTDAAYRVALERGFGDKWLDLQLDLWGALTQAIEKHSASPELGLV